MPKQNVCKICRREGQKLFLKGERCFSPKCALVRKPYPPGLKKKKFNSKLSEYGKELLEKQKLRNLYLLKEKQFRKYVKDVLNKRGQVDDAGLLLIRKLEKRLDNVVFRLGFVESRKKARQMVSHGFFLVDSKPVNIPSFNVKKGMVISIKENKKNKPICKEISARIKNYQTPAWLQLDKEKLSGKVIGDPSLDDTEIPVHIPSIFEFYSR